MDFDIHQLDRVDPEYDDFEEALEEYQDALLTRFFDSPEGRQRLDAEPGSGFWAAQLIYYGYQHLGVTVPRMTAGDVDEIVTRIFPRKISLHSPDDADDAIPELEAFWVYLWREFKLPAASQILEVLRDAEPDFKDLMNDSSNFGMAKSFVMMGQASGFDMTTREGMDAFLHAYNANLVMERTAAEPSAADRSRRRTGRDKQAKKKRKQAQATRKKNRKKRK